MPAGVDAGVGCHNGLVSAPGVSAVEEKEARDPWRHRRRWPVVAVLLVVLAGAFAAVVWFLWVPAYRPPLGTGERFGIDVSHHQGPIDWSRVAADDISFAYIKATEGGDFVDERFAENWDGAASAGVQRGAYHFFTLCRPADEQAAHFLRTVPEDPDALPLAVDLELSGNCSARPEPAVVERELATFFELVEGARGTEVVLYVGDDFEELYPVRERSHRPLWTARFFRRPEGEWWIWQVGGVFEVDGVPTWVDLDIMRPAEG